MRKSVLVAAAVAYAGLTIWNNLSFVEHAQSGWFPPSIERVGDALQRQWPRYAIRLQEFEKQCNFGIPGQCKREQSAAELTTIAAEAWPKVFDSLLDIPWRDNDRSHQEQDILRAAVFQYGDDLVTYCTPQFTYGVIPGPHIEPRLIGFSCPPNIVARNK